MSNFYYNPDNFSEDGMSREAMLYFAWFQMGGFSSTYEKCDVKNQSEYGKILVQEMGQEYINRWGTDVAGCIPGSEMRAHLDKVFGFSLDSKDGDRFNVYGSLNQGVDYIYIANIDEYVVPNDGVGGAFYNRYERFVQKAELQGDALYIYERVGNHFIDSNNTSDSYSFRTEDLDGNVLSESISDDFGYYSQGTEGFLKGIEEPILERGSLVKWTFVKKPDGHYVFKNLQRL